MVFLTFYYEAWDALAEIYSTMLADPAFEPIVVTIPRKLTGYEDFTDGDKISDFMTKAGVAHTRFDFEDSFEGLAELRRMAPDYIFLNYPWQRNYQPGYQIEQLAEFTKVCYVPYFSLPLVNEPGVTGVAEHLYTQPTHRQAHLVFMQDAATADALRQLRAEPGHVFFTGTPKIDALIAKAKSEQAAWPIEGSGGGEVEGTARRQRVIWAPHHSYGERWLNFGMFTELREAMLEMATRRQDLEIVLRPHPFLFGTLTDRELMTADEVAAWRAAWDALPNTATDEVGSYARLFLATDFLFTDGISFLAEYPLVTGKPSIFIEKPGHWAFTETGEIAAASSVRVDSVEALESLLAAGLPDRTAEIARLREVASPNLGESAAKIIDVVRRDFGS